MKLTVVKFYNLNFLLTKTNVLYIHKKKVNLSNKLLVLFKEN